MQTDGSFRQTLGKMKRLGDMLYNRLFTPVGTAHVSGLYQTATPMHRIPDDGCFTPADGLAVWGGDGVYGWFRAAYTVPPELDGKALFLYPRMGYYEGTLWVNGRIHSNYAAKEVVFSHGNHYCNRFTPCAHVGEQFRFDLECYAYHDMPGTSPFSDEQRSFRYPMGDMDVCLRDDELMAFLFDLRVLLSLRDTLDERSFRRAEVENALYQAHLHLLYDPDEPDFRQGLRDAHPYLKDALSKHNGDTAPTVSLVGHSHMDTAWLWPITETKKKCARTYANQLNLMAEYPEYIFVQSSAYHGDVIRRHYPELFARIQQAVAQGRYEPNGGVWVECDCNITGGEYMVRQFLWGQRFTRKYFNYTSDTFWLPDTFGYAFAIPQIMRGCGIKYFLTTKMAWNDTTHFPYTSFYWQGLDGTRVLTHLNRIHEGPSPKMYRDMTDGADDIREKRASSMRLFSFGKGDGGGGPEFEFLEMARRLGDVEGVARSRYQTVSSFMQELEKTIQDPSVYAGEMYLELHRGTLTNQHEIKRNNRKAEIALHDLEAALVIDAVRRHTPASEETVTPLLGKLLVRQFHDILPGTCIHSVHEEARHTVSQVIEDARRETEALLPAAPARNSVSLFNTLSFDREDTVYLTTDAAGAEGHSSQSFVDLDGQPTLAVSGVQLPALGAAAVSLTDQPCTAPSPFKVTDRTVSTPFMDVVFDEQGAIASLTDRRNGRQLVDGMPFNAFLMTEDVPASYDNWDLDADTEDKYRRVGQLLSRQIIADGAVELRIRSKYRISDKSTLVQDMVFDARRPMITFDTVMDWQDEHRFLKAAFDTTLHCDGVRSEIQFGHIRRSNHRSTDAEKARFEVCNHKYSDLSETSYGVALLNDCKYGLSAKEGSMRLSLHKGGMRPDRAGDKGRHVCRYALLVHDAPFGAESVIRPAYQFNYVPVAKDGVLNVPSLVAVSAPNVIVEAVKPCEDTDKAYILRLYEAAGDYASVRLSFGHPVERVENCSMLEETQGEADTEQLTFRPFEIRTLRVAYA